MGTRAGQAASALVVAALVVGPLTRRGWLLLLDWVPGPHMSVPRPFWGLDGAVLSTQPFVLVAITLGRIVGFAALGWIPIAIAVCFAFWAMARLVGGPPGRWLPAGSLYAVNPLVYERVFAGHVAYLVAYALLPIALCSLLKAARSRRPRDQVRPALWLTLLLACGLQLVWILGILVLAVVIATRRRLAVRSLGVLVVAVAGANAYLVVPLVGHSPPITVGAGDLVAFRTSADVDLGLLVNVAALYGFWRREPPLPKDDVPGWPFMLAAILLVAGMGAHRAWRRGGRRDLVIVLLVAGLLGYLLALGDQGPTGPAFEWLFFHLPGFKVMREPQKFLALVAMAYAALFGFGAECFASTLGSRQARALVTVGMIALPLTYTPTLLFGLAGRLAVSHYPDSWSRADDLMGAGTGRALFLPWHQYLSFPFTVRTVANPADWTFRRETIVGDNVELPSVATASRSARSAYLEFLYRNGAELCSFGDLTAPLGVEYIILARTADWQAYGWLDRQVDLSKVLDEPDLALYRNLRFRGVGWRAEDTHEVSDWGEVVGLSRAGRVSRDAVVVRDGRSPEGTIHKGDCSPPAGSPGTPMEIRRRSPVAFPVPPGPPATVVLTEPFEGTWQLHGQEALRLAGGVTGLAAEADGGTIRLGRWTTVRWGYAISAAALGLLFIVRLSGLPIRTICRDLTLLQERARMSDQAASPFPQDVGSAARTNGLGGETPDGREDPA